MPTPSGRYWLCTIPRSDYTPVLKDNICYLKGQVEIGSSTRYEHWQLLVVTNKKVTLNQLKRSLCDTAHVELSRSEAANSYVWKEDTAVAGTRFELGSLPLSRARKADWDKIWESAKSGTVEDIPKDVLIRNYSAIKRIRVDYCEPVDRPGITVKVFYGPTGTGKTHRAWDEAGRDAYIKNPSTKWWDGYKGQKNVIIDEFSGRIDITYLLTWLDKYPCIAEIKGYSVPLEAVNFWITSNMDPNQWYPEANENHKKALERRFTFVDYMEDKYIPNS